MKIWTTGSLTSLWIVFSTGLLHGAERTIHFGAPPVGQGIAALAAAPQPERLPIALATKTRDGASFTSEADWCYAAPLVMEDGETYTRLNLPGMAAGGEVGKPRIPYHGKFVRVPDGAKVRLVVQDVIWESIGGTHTVDPVQPPQSLAAGAPQPAFAKSAAAYTRDAWFPEAPVRIADRMRIRGRDFVFVVYTPVAYHPARAALRAAARVTWRLEYDLPVVPRFRGGDDRDLRPLLLAAVQVDRVGGRVRPSRALLPRR